MGASANGRWVQRPARRRSKSGDAKRREWADGGQDSAKEIAKLELQLSKLKQGSAEAPLKVSAGLAIPPPPPPVQAMIPMSAEDKKKEEELLERKSKIMSCIEQLNILGKSA